MGLAASGGVPAYIGNGHPQFFIFVEPAGGDDETVLVEQRSHKNLAVRTQLKKLRAILPLNRRNLDAIGPS